MAIHSFHTGAGIIDDENTANTSSFSQRYSNLKSIGSGGMSVVYVGHDKILDREVAIKRLKVSTQSERAWLRFEQEARACATLRHPNIVSIFDFGSDEEHVPYIVLDYLRGQTLAQLIEQKGPLLTNEVFEIIMPVLDGLEHAHKNGVVHRDLKPANVFLQRLEPSNQLVAKIMDFGIAKVISDRESGFETKTGEVFGSPFYISPEQLSGDPVDGRADLYAVGCMLFEMLSGKPPFVGKSVLATFMMHKSDTAPLLSERLKGRPVSQRLEKIVSRLLQKAPQDRYDDIAQLRDDLNLAKEEWNSLRTNLEDEKRFAQGKRVRRKYAQKLKDTFQQTGPFLRTPKGMVAIFLLVGVVVTICVFILAPVEPDRHPGKITDDLEVTSLTARSSLKRASIEDLKECFHDRDNKKLTVKGVSNFSDLLLPAAHKFPFVNHLLFQEMPLSVSEIQRLTLFKHLSCLQLKDTFGLNTDQLNAIASIKQLHEVEIRATGTPIADDAFSSFKNLPLKILTLELDLSKKNVDDIASMSSLTYLAVNSSKLDEKWLLKLATLKNLETLHLDGDEITGDCLRILPELKMLTKLSLRGNPLSKRALAVLPPIFNVEVLDIEGCLRLGDSELAELSRVFPNTRLLTVKNTNVTDNGAIYLTRFKALQDVDLARTQVSNRSIPLLAGMLQLRSIELDNSKVDSDGIFELMRRRSGMRLEATYHDDYAVNDRLYQVAKARHIDLHLKEKMSATEFSRFQQSSVDEEK